VSAGLPRVPHPLLIRGVNQKSPRQIGVEGELDLLQNMQIVKASSGDVGFELIPRNGSANLPRTADVGSIITGMRLGTLGSGLVLLTGLSCYRKAIDQWHRVSATAPTVGVDTKAITADTLRATACDQVYANGYTVAATTSLDATGGNFSVHATVRDSNGNKVIDSNLETGVVGPVKLVVVTGNVVLAFWVASPGTIRAAKFNTGAPSAFSAPVNVVVASTATPFDVQVVPASGNIAVIYVTGGGAVAQLLFTPGTMTSGAATTYGFAVPDVFLYMTNDYATNTIYLAHIDSVNGVRETTFDGTTLVLGATTVFDAASTQATNVAGKRAAAARAIYFTVGTGPVYDHQIKVTTGAAATTVMRSVELASRVLVANGTLYALAKYRGTNQGTYYLLDLLAKVSIGEALPDVAFIGATSLPNLAVAATSNTWLTSGLKNLSVTTQNGAFLAYVGSSSISFTFQDSTVGKPVELNSGLHIPGAQPYYYDGSTLTEHGFPIVPEQSDAPVPAAGGSMTPASVYTYRYVYEWVDAVGNLWRSAPSIVPQSVSLGATDTRVTLSLPTLRVTRKTNVSIAVYRTLANGDGTVYFKVSTATAPVINDPTIDRMAFVDTVSDVIAASGEPIYTTGSVLENIAIPPCRTMSVHRGRLLVAAVAGDVDAVWFSKDVVPGFAVEFSDFLVSRITSVEPITAVGSRDSYAIACTATQSWSSANEYPDDTGAGGVLIFQQQSNTTGCATIGMMAGNDQGAITYAGTKGIWRMSRGLSWDYVGAAVDDDIVGFNPVAILSVPGQNQMRVVGGGASALVYEALWGQWAKWSYTQAPAAFVDAVMWNGSVAYLCSNGTVVVEDTTTFDDNGVSASVAHVVTFSDVNLYGVAGFGRLYITQLTGRVVGDGNGFTLTAAQNFDGTAGPSKALAMGANAALNFEVDPGTFGKSSSYALTISDSGNGPNSAFTIAAITALIGMKKGLNKLPPARRAT
jgi:hypothetical protein